MNLFQQKCVPCEVGSVPMKENEARERLAEISGWALIDSGAKIEKLFTFANFKEAMSFVNKVADIAENEGHHPNIVISYSNVTITIWTHMVGGLTLNDFILAAKIDARG
ncbi:MAG: 4a-hydroxytetrahydrobiopterin dehydratase [Patescibacteria group bacterium]